MKTKRAVISLIMMLISVVSYSQVTLLKHYDFENGLPSGFTTSSTTNVTVEEKDTIAINGKKFARVKHGSGDQYLQTEAITINAGELVRLEFNHIPFSKSQCRVQLVFSASGAPTSLSGNNVYDNKYAPGLSGQGNSFKYTQYYTEGIDISKEKNIDSSMWHHEVYYLTNKLNSNTTFYVRFTMPNATDDGWGWLIDDVKIYTGSVSSILVPRFNTLVSCPQTFNYPYCSDAELEFELTGQTATLSTVADSLYVLYRTPSQSDYTKVNLTKNASDGHYLANIPYMGIDSVVYYKVVVTDAVGNQTTYPFVGNDMAFKYLRPYTGNDPVKKSGTSSEALIFATKSAKVSHQIRYSADELKAAGYGPGVIGGFYLNIKSRPSGTVTLNNFRVYIGSVSSKDMIDAGTGASQYSKVTNMINQASYLLPDTGWQYFSFDEGKTFLWDGETDIILKSCYENTQTYGDTKVQSFSAGSSDQYKTHRLEQSASTPVSACTGSFNTDATGTIGSKPNIRFGFINKCYFNLNAGVRQDTLLLPTPAVDCYGNLTKMVKVTANTPTAIKLYLRNDGLDTVKSLKVKWMIDDDATTIGTTMWTGTMRGLDASKKPQDTSTAFTATTAFSCPEGVHTLKVWCEMPTDDLIDWDFDNDTITVKVYSVNGAMAGTYAIGGSVEGVSSLRTYKTFDDAFRMLKNAGVGGKCKFKIATGVEQDSINNGDIIYADNIDFPTCEITGLSSENTIEFVNVDNTHKVVFMPKTNTQTSIFDLRGIKHFKFNNLTFSLNKSMSSLTTNSSVDFILLDNTSEDISFTNCEFISYDKVSTYYTRVNSIINLDGSSITATKDFGIEIDSCLFEQPATNIITAKGFSTSVLLSGLKIKNSTFNIISDNKSFVENAINLQYVKDVQMERNTFLTPMTETSYAKLTSQYYAISANNADNLDISKNKFTLNSISAVTLTDVSNSNVDNNIVSLNNVSSNAVAFNQYGINLQSGDNNNIVYNNIYSRSIDKAIKKNYAVSLGGSNLTTTNNVFKNNIIVSSGYGYGVAMRPSSESSFDVSRNWYYKDMSEKVVTNYFSLNGSTTTDTATWKQETGDTLSILAEDPLFPSWDDLNTNNIDLCAAGDWVSGVEDDYYNKERPTQTENKRPCIGNKEFDPPTNNIYVVKTGLEEFDEVMTDTYTGCDFENEKVYVEFKNISANTIAQNSLSLAYSVDGVVVGTKAFADSIEPNVIKKVVFDDTHNFKALTGNETFEIKAYSILSVDTVKTNDTATASVISYYRLPALDAQTSYVKYGLSDTVDVSTICADDSVYWYYTQSDSTYFYKGKSFITESLYSDSTIYFARRDEKPILRIAEVQFSKDATKEGITTSLPSYISANNAFEIANCGAEDLDLTGYRFVYYSGTSLSKENTSYTFPDGYILKGHSSVVLVAVSSLTVGDSIAIAVNASKFKINATAKGGLAIVNPNGVFLDALTFNGAKFAASMNVPTTIWNDDNGQITMTTTAAGIIRNSVATTDATNWTVSSEVKPMTMGTYNSDLTDYTESLCMGYLTPYNIIITDVPNYDPGITEVRVGSVSSSDYTSQTPYKNCQLGEDSISITVSNTGLMSLDTIPLVCEIYDNGALIETINDTIIASQELEGNQNLAQFASMNYTLPQTLDMTSNTMDRKLVVKVYSSHSGDIIHNNDTMYLYIVSQQTPLPPTTYNDTVDYSSSATLSAESEHEIIWYNSPTSTEELTRGTTYTTPILYENTTYYVEAFNKIQFAEPLGEDTNKVTSSAPSPSMFNTKTKNIKEQYLINKDTLLAYGYSEGNIKGLSSYILSLSKASSSSKLPDTLRYTSYIVKIGTTDEVALSAWQEDLTTVYDDTLEILATFSGWRDITFTEPYYWDGNSNLVLEVCYSAANSVMVTTYTVPTDQVQSLSIKKSNASVCSDVTTAPSTFSKIPYLKFNMEMYGCVSERAEVTAVVENPPTCDIGVKNIVSPASENIISGEEIPIQVEIKNFGTDSIQTATINWTVNDVQQTAYTYSPDTALAPNETRVVEIGTYTFNPGPITIEVDAYLDCDNTPQNDTVKGSFAACIGKDNTITTLTIGGTTSNYATVQDAIDNLKISGICGPIVFDIAEGTYYGSLDLTDINGINETNTITFEGVGEVIVTDTNSTNLLAITNISNVYFKNITFKVDSAFTALALLNNTNSIHFDNITFEAGTEANPIVKLVSLTGKNDSIYFHSSTFLNGYSSIENEHPEDGSTLSTIVMDSCSFTDFKAFAVSIRDYSNMTFAYNKVRAHTNDYIDDVLNFTDISGVSKVFANEIILTDGAMKARSGIVVRRATGDDVSPFEVINNSILISSTGTSKLKTHGIDIDSSNFVSVYYNTVYVAVSSKNTNTRSLYLGKSNMNVSVRNNNLDNSCGGYAYYVEGDGSSVVLTDNNNYTTTGSKFVYWGNKDCATVAALQTANSFDANSVSIENKFKSDTCLEFLSPTNIITKAEPIDNCTVDIYGNNRPTSPKPTIGAYEYQFIDTDCGIVEMTSPVSNTTYIEGDDITVQVVLQNFGKQSITSLPIGIKYGGHIYTSDVFQTKQETRSGNALASMDTSTFTFTGKLTAHLNSPASDSCYVQVFTMLSGDTVYYNDTLTVPIKVIPGKDLQLVSVKKQGTTKCGVQMRNQEIEVVIKNVGNKAVVQGDVINVTYEVKGETGQMKKTATEQITFPYTYTNTSGNSVTLNTLAPNASITNYKFNSKVNMEPTGGNDTTWTVRAYAKLSDDSNPANDTVSKTESYVAYVSPSAPIAYDTSVYYGTEASARVSQAESISVRWFHDTTDANPFYKPSTYATSTILEIATPIYADTSFYVNVLSKNSGACPSDFTKVNVKVKPRCAVDIKAIAVVEPPAQPKKGYMFMSEDTVKVKLANFGSQTVTNFPITCSIRPLVPANSPATTFTETCNASIMKDDTVVYTFKQLFDFTTSTKNYEVKVWVHHNSDCVNVNDTTPAIKVMPVTSVSSDSKVVGDSKSLNITQVQLGSMDNYSSSVANDYSDFTESVTAPELFRGLKDSLLISITPSSDMEIEEDQVITGWVKAWIDWDRNGAFDTATETVYSGEAVINGTNRTLIQVPDSALNGYTIMRVIVSQDDSTHKFGPTPGSTKYAALGGGEIEDYKIHISPAKTINAELTRFVTPERQDTVRNAKVVVRLRNAGLTDLTSADITWIYKNDTTVYNWTGTLHSSEIEDVELSELELDLGHNNFKAYVTVANDEYHPNDTITLNNYIYPIYTLPYTTEFDEANKANYDFYAYEADPKRLTNLWEMGTPSQTGNDAIKAAYSNPYCWKTNIEGKYTMDNSSILYSPMFNITEIKPDTLSFMMRREFGPGVTMTVEYMNYKGVWKVLGTYGDEYGKNWYDSEDGFTSSNVSWEKSSYSMDAVSGDLGKITQLRFVFTSTDGHIADGVAIDDFRLDRALRDYDAGVTSIVLTPEEVPSYGQYFYPKVTVHNYGKKDITSFKVCYLAESMYITQCEDVMQTIPAGSDIDYTFQNGKYLSVDMPDPFSITAYTRLNPNDLYTDNDTATSYFVIQPLLYDVGLLEITKPMTKVAAQDKLNVAVKLKNYGVEPIEYLPISYTIGGEVIEETIHFVPELNNGDEYIYNFTTPFQSPFGTINLKVWTGYQTDMYPDNDTLYLRLKATNTSSDLEAKYITLDEDGSQYSLQFTFMNSSSKPLDSIIVGYYLNGDMTMKVEENFRDGKPLEASTMGYHTFATKINKSMYQSVCAYVSHPSDENLSNDTTCSVYLGYKDMQADSIMVEQNANKVCKVQLRAHHIGTLAGNGKVKASYVVDGDYAHPVTQTFDLLYDEPIDKILYLTFDKGVARNDNSQYNIVAWVNYDYDINKSNDTTSKVIVQSSVGLEDIQSTENEFRVSQNRPNPFTNTCEIEVYLPTNGHIYIDVQDINGRIVYTTENNYVEGNHKITLPLENLPSGTYYYTVRYEKQRITKKMIKLE